LKKSYEGYVVVIKLSIIVFFLTGDIR